MQTFISPSIDKKKKKIQLIIFNNTMKKNPHVSEEIARLHFYAKLMLIISPLLSLSHPLLANCYKQLRAKIHSS